MEIKLTSVFAFEEEFKAAADSESMVHLSIQLKDKTGVQAINVVCGGAEIIYDEGEEAKKSAEAAPLDLLLGNEETATAP